MSYFRPAGDVRISDSFQGHKNRTPPSVEPGVDYACVYGTPIKAPHSGVVDSVKLTNTGAPGRAQMLHFDDGNWGRGIHLSRVLVPAGARFEQGQTVAYSGASAWGHDWGVGAHLHWTWWPSRGNAAPVPGLTAPSDYEAFLATQSTEVLHWPARALYGEAWVKAAQKKLQRMGYDLVVDGKDGPVTQKHTKHFQGTQGLFADGIFGPATNARADAILTPAATYPIITVALMSRAGNVQGFQKVARFGGYKGAIDNIWGAGSQAGMINWLNHNGYRGNPANWLRARWGYVGNDQLGPVMLAKLKTANARNNAELK